MFVCICNRVTEAQVEQAVSAHSDPEEVASALGLYNGRCCGRCASRIHEIVSMVDRRQPVA
jgi:bacterioferritin-associated ferredoxin